MLASENVLTATMLLALHHGIENSTARMYNRSLFENFNKSNIEIAPHCVRSAKSMRHRRNGKRSIAQRVLRVPI